MKLSSTIDGAIDLSFGPNGIALEQGLESAVIVSLLTDRRAGVEDVLPERESAIAAAVPPDRRGWAGDALSEWEGDRIGSRLWLLAREKQTESTLRRAVDYAREALQWLIDDGHARTVDIAAQWAPGGRLEMRVTIETRDRGSIQLSVQTGVTYAL